MSFLSELYDKSIEDYLSQEHSLHPVQRRGAELYYHSPLNSGGDSTPSFSVNTNKNVWFDHSTGKSGTIIQLHRLLAQGVHFEPNKLKTKSYTNHAEQTPTLTAVKELGNNPALSEYLQSRGIDLTVAEEAGCKEIYYKTGGRSFFAIGFPNNKLDSYELRNKYSKICLGAKDITTIGNSHKSDTVSVFEGFMDYLSHLSHKKQEGVKAYEDTVVLNSVALYNTKKEDILNFIGTHKNVNLFLDNDKAGKNVSDDIIRECGKMTGIENVFDCSATNYQDYKDLNEWWLARLNGEMKPLAPKSQADELIAAMEQNAEPMPKLALTAETWIQEFGDNDSSMVRTPIGDVKMGANQYFKMIEKNRLEEFGMVKPTLTNPDVVLDEYDPKESVERNSKYLFVKTFEKDNQKFKFFTSITVKQDGLEVAISNHLLKSEKLKRKLENCKIIYKNEILNSIGSEMRLAKNPKGLPDLLPTQELNISPEVSNSIASAIQGQNTPNDKDTKKNLNNQENMENSILIGEFGGVKLAPEQSEDLKNGKTIFLKGVINSITGAVKDVYLRRSSKTGLIEDVSPQKKLKIAPKQGRKL